MDLQVDRSELMRTRLVDEPPPDLQQGQALLRVDRFGLTANNITYAVFGDAMRYWDFFPAEPGWGRIPVWGFADVVASAHGEVAEGTRVFGYLPMGTHLVVAPGRVDGKGFVDTSEHRRPMASAYNHYRLADAGFAPDEQAETHQMVLRPLFYTSWLIDDFLGDNLQFGASSLVLSSASSKTAVGLAAIARTREDVEVVGLTSPGHVAFVQGLGCYDRVATYDAVDDLPVGPAVFVDMAGSAEVRAAVHARYGDHLVHSSVVGATHWQATPSDAELPGPRPAFFFAPDQIRKRTKEWGQEELDARFGEAWDRVTAWCATWLRIERSNGPEAAEHAYQEVLTGRSDPAVGHVVSLWP